MRTSPIRAAPEWDEVVFVCADCMQRGSGELAALRKWLKTELKAQGLKKRVRVVECGCLDLCPKQGVVLARGRELAAGDAKKLRVHRQGDDPGALLHWLTASPETEQNH